MNPNHYLAVAIRYLLHAPPRLAGRRRRRQDAGVEQRSSTASVAALGAQAARGAGRLQVVRRPACSTAASASAARRARAPASCAATAASWTTDKDGLDPGPAGRGDHRRHRQGSRRSTTQRADGAASARRTTRASTRRPRPPRRSALKKLAPEAVTATELAGEPIAAKLTRAPGNGAAIGGLKVATDNGWFAARPVGDGERLQDLRRELEERGAPARDPGRSAADRRRGAGRRGALNDRWTWGSTGKVALVTGASRGIGRAIALALAAEGARVVDVRARRVTALGRARCARRASARGADGAAHRRRRRRDHRRRRRRAGRRRASTLRRRRHRRQQRRRLGRARLRRHRRGRLAGGAGSQLVPGAARVARRPAPPAGARRRRHRA